MRPAIVVLAALLSLPARGEERCVVLPSDSDVPQCIDSGTPAPATGVWLRTDVAARVATKGRQCEEDKTALQKALQEKPLDVPGYSGATLAVAGGLGLVVGAIVGVVLVAAKK